MGCCGPQDKNVEDFPFEKIEDFNNLKSELSEIISDKEHKQRKNINKLFELFNKTSNKINEFEREVKKLKNKKLRNSNVNNDVIKGLNDDIKQLREYNHTLNDLIKESDDNEIVNNNDINANDKNNINNSEKKFENGIFDQIQNEVKNDFENEIINEEINVSNNDIKNNDNEETNNLRNINNKNIINNNINNEENNIDNYLENEFETGYKNNTKSNFQDETENDFQEHLNNINNINDNNEKAEDNYLNNNINDNSEENSNKEIYFKKSIRRNKKSAILNRKSNPQKDFSEVNYFLSQEMEKKKHLNNNNINIRNEKVFENYLNEEGNIIDLVFILENGFKLNFKVEKNEKLFNVIEKAVDKEDIYKNIENILIFDENNNITDRVMNGEIISSFGFKDQHNIHIKLKN